MTQGPIFSDSVTIAGLSVTDQQFSPVNQESGFTNSPQDGLVGLGYQSLSQIGAPTLFQTLFAQGLVDKNQFTFTLLSSGSELFLGGTDSANDFTFTPVSLLFVT